MKKNATDHEKYLQKKQEFQLVRLMKGNKEEDRQI